MKFTIEYYSERNGSLMCEDVFESEEKDAAGIALELMADVPACDYAYVTDEHEDTFGIDKSGSTF